LPPVTTTVRPVCAGMSAVVHEVMQPNVGAPPPGRRRSGRGRMAR
jgi:hypothetical protein